MSTTNDTTPTGYNDDEDVTARTVVEERVAKTKKKSKLLPVVFAVILLSVALVVGYMLFGYKKPAPKPKAKPAVEQVKTPADQAPADGAPTDGAPVDGATDPNALAVAQTGVVPTDPNAAQQPALDPLTGQPVGAAQQPALDPITGLPAASQPLDPMQPAAQQQQAAQQQAAQQQAAQQQAAQQQAPVVTPVGAPVVQPSVDPLQAATQQAAAQAATAQQAADAAVQQAQQQAPVAAPVVQPTVDEQAALDPNDPLAQFRTLLAPIDSRVSKLEKKFSGLEKTVRNIQATLGMSFEKSSKQAKARSYDRPRSTEVRISSPVVRAVSPPVSRVIIEDGRSSSYSEPVRMETQPSYSSDSCNAQAIVQGRFWIKRADGSFVSFGEGDTWTDGSVIQSIDPARGVNAGGRWICMH